jgi:hypothetical protein
VAVYARKLHLDIGLIAAVCEMLCRIRELDLYVMKSLEVPRMCDFDLIGPEKDGYEWTTRLHSRNTPSSHLAGASTASWC